MKFMQYLHRLRSGAIDIRNLTVDLTLCHDVKYVKPVPTAFGLDVKVGLDIPMTLLKEIYRDLCPYQGRIEGSTVRLILRGYKEKHMSDEKNTVSFEGQAQRGVFGVSIEHLVTSADSSSDCPITADIALMGAEDWFNHICDSQQTLDAESWRAKGSFTFKGQASVDEGLTEYNGIVLAEKETSFVDVGDEG